VQISSTSNSRVRALAQLKDRRGRDESGLFLIEGAREIGRAADAGILIKEVLFCRELANIERASMVEALRDQGLPILELAPAPFAKIAYRRHPDGVIGVAHQSALSITDLKPPPDSVTLVAEAIEKPGNLGAMIRTADAAGCAAVIAADPVSDIFNPNVVRAAQGSLFALPVVTAAPAGVISWAKRRQVRLIAAEPAAVTSVWDVDLTGSIAIVIGSEHAGLSAAWQGMVTPAAIPMQGTADSLNASVAAAVLLFEAQRQRRQAPSPAPEPEAG
jgi:TrmH family RNA methyltransferase